MIKLDMIEVKYSLNIDVFRLIRLHLHICYKTGIKKYFLRLI